MANIKYSELLDEVLPYLAADPSDPVTENAIKRSVIEFCAGSWIWKHLPDPLDVVAGESAYDIEPIPGTDVTTVLAAELDGVPLAPKDIPWLNREIPRWRTVAARPKYFTQVDAEQVMLAALPDVSIPAGLTMTLALQPSHASTGFPKWIFNQYIYVLAEGSLAKLMMMPNKPWTDIENGADRRTKFEAGIANARASAVSALGSAPQRVSSQH